MAAPLLKWQERARAIARSPADAFTKAELYATRVGSFSRILKVPPTTCTLADWHHWIDWGGPKLPSIVIQGAAAMARVQDSGIWEEPPWIDDLAEASCGFPNRPQFCNHPDALLHEMAEPWKSDGDAKDGLQKRLNRTLMRCLMPSTMVAKFRERTLKWFPMAAGAANSLDWNAHQERLMTMAPSVRLAATKWARDGALDTYLGGLIILFDELPLDVAAPPRTPVIFMMSLKLLPMQHPHPRHSLSPARATPQEELQEALAGLRQERDEAARAGDEGVRSEAEAAAALSRAVESLRSELQGEQEQAARASAARRRAASELREAQDELDRKVLQTQAQGVRNLSEMHQVPRQIKRMMFMAFVVGQYMVTVSATKTGGQVELRDQLRSLQRLTLQNSNEIRNFLHVTGEFWLTPLEPEWVQAPMETGREYGRKEIVAVLDTEEQQLDASLLHVRQLLKEFMSQLDEPWGPIFITEVFLQCKIQEAYNKTGEDVEMDIKQCKAKLIYTINTAPSFRAVLYDQKLEQEQYDKIAGFKGDIFKQALGHALAHLGATKSRSGGPKTGLERAVEAQLNRR
ncbi:unnamed protein product [Prorocentrum cordatum]|uniref:Uncharacterized protein n=1 Tax=Prorocentrum cordatum TaxID=2364126 RepID=A0ABN9S0T0_9DINO|nr:unnamed protein product [Polarella glacialis]